MGPLADDIGAIYGWDMSKKTETVEVLEMFTFRDGSVRLAWVTWQIGDGERRCVGVREL